MPTKTEITQRIIDTSDRPGFLNLEIALKTWYQNIRPTGGMRLTTYGYKILRALEIESWAWALPKEKGYIDKKLLLDLDRKLEYPYFINAKTREIVFFSSREAMMASLYGDIKPWLKGLVSRRNDDDND